MSESLVRAATNLAKREEPRVVVATGLLFSALSQHHGSRSIGTLLESYRGGTWGTEAAEGCGYRVLRSTNMRGARVDVRDAAWRGVPDRQAKSCTLQAGDILVAKSSGSSDLVGKATIFEDPGDGAVYLFSNFLIRLRPDPRLVVPDYLAWFLRSPQGLSWRFQAQQTAVGLRNLDTDLYLSQAVPCPPLGLQSAVAAYLRSVEMTRDKIICEGLPEYLSKQHRIVCLQSKADALTRLHTRIAADLDALMPSILYEAFRGEL